MTENPYKLAALVGVGDPYLIRENYRSEALAEAIATLDIEVDDDDDGLSHLPTTSLRAVCEIAAGVVGTLHELDRAPLESPGAVWLRRVAREAAEMVDEVENIRPESAAEELGDLIVDRADALVPIYTYERWQVFVDLEAYNFDAEDYGIESTSDMTDQVGRILYGIAIQLMTELVREATAIDETD